MKTLIVPTAPGERDKYLQASAGSFGRIVWLLCCVILSLTAGIVGAMVVSSNNQSAVVFVANDESVSTATIAHYITDHDSDSIVTIQHNDSTIGQGIIVSSDGWCALVGSLFTDVSADANQFTVTNHSGEIKPVTNLVTDPYSGIVFVKIAGQGLPMVNFAATPALGDLVVVYGKGIAVTYLGDVSAHLGDSYTTTTNSVFYQLDRTVADNFIGTPAFDRKGNVIGLVSTPQMVIPVQLISAGLESIFKSTTIIQHQLDLTYTPTLRGAKITASSLTDIQVGDIIQKVDDTAIDQTHDLSQVLDTLTIGTTTHWLVDRQGSQQTVALVIQ